jgi:hypothetical protein
MRYQYQMQCKHKRIKKLICIYLALVMVLTGCGQVKRLTGGSDITIKNQDENKNEKSDNNSGKEIVPADPTPSPTPTPEPTADPLAGDKGKNEASDKGYYASSFLNFAEGVYYCAVAFCGSLVIGSCVYALIAICCNA